MKENSFAELIQLMARLRGFPPPGCPWDKKQNHKSLLPYVVEETYEVVEAVEAKDHKKLCEELGDLLLQIIFHAQIANENKEFGIYDVVEALKAKLVRRHPHIFGDKQFSTPEEVKVEWEKIKLEQEGEKRESLMDGIPLHLPALLRAQRIQERAAEIGFDWGDYTGPLEKLYEELKELEAALKSDNKENIKDELGDILFAMVNIFRFMGINAEEALRGTSRKFITRFKKVEKAGKNLSLEEMENIWQKSKEEEKND